MTEENQVVDAFIALAVGNKLVIESERFLAFCEQVVAYHSPEAKDFLDGGSHFGHSATSACYDAYHYLFEGKPIRTDEEPASTT